MGPAVWAYSHPVLVLLLAALIVFSGLLAVGRLPIDLATFNGYPQIRVRVLDPGVPATVMEDRVTRPLEQALADIPGSVNMVSASSEGLSEIAIFVDGARNLASVRRQVGAQFESLRSVLPAGVVAPQMEIRDSDHVPVAELVVRSSTRTLAQLQAWVEESFVPQFVDIPGFDRIEIVGGQMRELHIVPDQPRLAALGLALADVIDVLRAHQLQADSSLGARSRQRSTSPIHGLDRGSFAQDATQSVGALSLRLANGDAVALSEVTSIQEVEDDNGERVYLDAMPALRLLLFKRPGASTLSMVETFKSRLAWLRTNKLIPPPVQVEWWANPLIELKRMGRSFLTLSAASLLVALLIAGMFCRNVRGLLLTFATAIVSLMLVFTFYRLAGLGINAQALGGMLLGYGFIFGLPLVVLDILSLPPLALDQDARRRAAQRLLFAILLLAAAVLASLLVYGGLPGLIFRDAIISLASTIAAASLISITLVPALVRAAHPAGPMPQQAAYESWLRRLYTAPRRVALVTLAALMLIPAGLYYYRDKQDFLTPPDSVEVLLYVDVQPEMPREQMASVLSALELLARGTGDVVSVLTHMTAAGSYAPVRPAYKTQLLRIRLSPEMQRKGGAAAWMHNFEQVAAASGPKGITLRTAASLYLAAERFEDPIMRALSGEVYWRVYGPDRTVLARLGEGMAERLRALPGLRHVRLTAGAERLETVVRLAPEHAAEPGLDDMAIARALRIARGGLVIGDIPNAGRHVRLRVILSEPQPRPGLSLPRLLLRGEINERAAIYLDDIADSEELPRPLVRWRDEQRPMIEVRATLESMDGRGRALSGTGADESMDGRGRALSGTGAEVTDTPSTDVLRTVRDNVEHYDLPVGYHGELAGFIDSVARATQRSLVLLGLAGILLLGVLLLVLRAAGTSLLVGINVMLAWAGGIGGMVVSGLAWSVPVWLGSIILTAFAAVLTWVTMHGIYLVRRHPTHAATLKAAAHCSGPMVLGFGLCGFICLAPLASGWVPGFEWLQPLAVLVASGMAFSLVGNLFLTPILFCRLQK